MTRNNGFRNKSASDVVLEAILGVLVAFLLVAGFFFVVCLMCLRKEETLPAETVSTVEYQDDEVQSTFAVEETVPECEHKWSFSEEESTLIRTVKLESVASGGVEEIYLTRHRESFDNEANDIYIAYDENFEDIVLHYGEGSFEIKCFSSEVENEIPRLEEYEFSVQVCEKCGISLDVLGMPKTMYKFYIPEGTYFISH